MLTARNLNFAARPAPDGDIQQWMWNGAKLDEQLKIALPHGTANIFF